MPCSLSGVMLLEYMVPMGDAKGAPPANGLPPFTVWQATQSPMRARYSPRTSGSLEVAPSMGGAGRCGSAVTMGCGPTWPRGAVTLDDTGRAAAVSFCAQALIPAAPAASTVITRPTRATTVQLGVLCFMLIVFKP